MIFCFKIAHHANISCFFSFAYMEINLILAKMLWTYDLELLDQSLDWVAQSQLHVMWWKPELMVRFRPRQG